MKKSILLLIIFVTTSTVYSQSDIIFFSDSPTGDVYYDYSWGYNSSPSYLELVGPGTSKFPVDPQHSYQGVHSLRLNWQSASSGDWGIAVASVGWTGYDITNYDSLTYWINSAQAVTQTNLPDLALEDLNNHKSNRVWIGGYFSGVDSDSTTWQQIMVPISAFAPGPQNCDFTKIKTIYHFQKNTDNQSHSVWLDEIRIISTTSDNLPSPVNVAAQAHDSRIDLAWDYTNNPLITGYYIYRCNTINGVYLRLNTDVQEPNVFSDFIGGNDSTFYYYVTSVNNIFQESPPSDTVFATTFAMTTDELLNSVQEATFRYFYDYAHPVSGLVRERKNSYDICTSGGTGFGLMALPIGVERGFVSRDSAAARALKILNFMQNDATRYHGTWSHWINGETGATIPFSQYDDGGDLVETAYVVQGLLTIRQYFDQVNTVESDIRTIATQLFEDVEWDWYRKDPPQNVLYWHWSPNYGWQMNMQIRGFNETMITYLLAIASPTHPVPASLYHNGWAGSGYINGSSYYGLTQWVGPAYGGPLFFTHYSFLGFDPRDKEDQYCNYFNNNRNISLIHREYSISNPYSHVGYDSLVWGLTACDNPWGYSAHQPVYNDNGTVAPTAAISAMPYTPNESIATLKHYYHVLGPNLWGEFGFRDAFNFDEDQDWYADSYLAIDQGPIIIMIENHRTQLCWDLFMANPEIPGMLTDIGFVPTAIEDESDRVVKNFKLNQNYPNPFNNSTIISFDLPAADIVSLEVYNVLGERVSVLINDQKMQAGKHSVNLNAENLSSSIYFYQIKTSAFKKTKRMLLLK